ncbi:hypothetical protein EV210_103299 [Anaerospora hongkongensis]|uniref:Uncharacterized protein n=1 Tax=Anaerospora hongkongensis TaxID=244830 RepID=A0A4R1Q057_9FIRM|nr:hypothetical protein [Anaerospora hongkongensis]TCL38815.1 hypothetical protein EV210_103299 [Anaerospora hongkongensis]
MGTVDKEPGRRCRASGAQTSDNVLMSQPCAGRGCSGDIGGGGDRYRAAGWRDKRMTCGCAAKVFRLAALVT